MNLPSIPNIDLTKVGEILAAGGAAAAALIGFQKQVADLVDKARQLAAAMQAPEIQAVLLPAGGDLLDHPADLGDLDAWHPVGRWIDDPEIQARHRSLAEALAVQNYAKGFVAAVQLVSMFGGAA